MCSATTHPTYHSNDEYEDPGQIETVKINRIKAGSALSEIVEGEERLGKSVIGQMLGQMKNWPSNVFRRKYVGRGHGGQSRCFKVKLVGEGANDYGGPYRQVFDDVSRELELIGLLKPTPNNKNSVGEGQELLTFPPNCGGEFFSVVCEKDGKLVDYQNLLKTETNPNSNLSGLAHFLGKLTGASIRGGVNMKVALPLSSWRAICGDEAEDVVGEVNEVDSLLAKLLLREKEGEKKTELASVNEMFGWSSEHPELDLHTAQRTKLLESTVGVKSWLAGMSNVVPVELFNVFEGSELREMICGANEVEVDLLMKVTEYEGCR